MTRSVEERREEIRLGVQEARERIDQARTSAGRVDPVRLRTALASPRPS